MNTEKLLWIYERMCLIRKFEQHVHQIAPTGRLPGFVHLYLGEEAVAVGVMAHLTDRDYITSTHRGHGHCVAKGVDVRGMMAEIYAKATGVCRGKGGSMHIADVDKGMLGANGIVGGGPPLACGAALSASVRQTDQVTACFFGDGASNQGTFHESANLAAIWDLPVIFVLENNDYAQTTPREYAVSANRLTDRAAGYNMPSESVDGMDVFAVHDAAGKAVSRARAGKGPTLLECKTYRFLGHCETDNLKYRSREEEAKARQRDPIELFRRRVLGEGLLSEQALSGIDERTEAMIREAVEFAEGSPLPDAQECLADVYSSYA